MKYVMIFIFATSISSMNAHSFGPADIDLLREAGLSGPKIMLHTDEWEVKPSKIDIDGFVYKGQGKSLINWKMSHLDWLDFNYWKQQRKARDTMPDWKIRLRDVQHVELVGKVIKCHGTCHVFRGHYQVNADYMSRIYEGDELITSDNSYAWVAMADGSIFRISPKTSMTFNEINIGVKDIIFFIRLNHGHISWQVRKTGKYDVQNLAETDLMFYPLMLIEANRDNFSRLEYQAMDHDQRLLYQTRTNLGHVSQYKKLNELMQSDKEVLQSKNSKLFLVTPNSSFITENAHFDIHYSTNGTTEFKFFGELEGFKNDDPRESKVTAYLRGYNNKKETPLSDSSWYEVASDGKSINAKDLSSMFKTNALFTRRTPTIHMAREIIMRESFAHLLLKDNTAEHLATEFGYRLWDIDGKEFEQRMSYLKEYTRRVETTNMNSLRKVFKKHRVVKFNSSFYNYALNKHLFKLKNMYSKSRSIIPELTDIQYYIWTLKYAQK